MDARVQKRQGGESGFTLVELLVVMLILGVLAAIALPSFFNQTEKAGDAKAKGYAHTAQVAMEACYSDKDGTYAGCTVAALKKIEPDLKSATKLKVFGKNAKKSPEESAYTVRTEGTSGTFSIENNEGTMKFTCSAPKKGGCPAGGVWGT